MKNKNIAINALIIAMLAISAPLAIPIGPVPISLQSLFVILSGIVLGAKNGMISISIYIIMGLIGFPIFSGMNGGLGYILSPTFGFLLSFIPAAAIVGVGFKTQNAKLKIISILMANLTIYIGGIIYFYFIKNIYLNGDLNFYQILKFAVIPFIPGDIIKSSLAYIIGERLRAYLNIEQKLNKTY